MPTATMSDWLVVFTNSRANGGFYPGAYLPISGWWQRPAGTWLQKRLEELREKEADDGKANSN